MAVTTRYATVAWEQIPFFNLPGGGPIAQGSGTGPFAQGPFFNDPGLEIGNVRQVTAIYQMYGNEVNNDIINIYLAQPGSMVDPVRSSVAQVSPATTLSLNIGDDDVTGQGLLSNPIQQTGLQATLPVAPGGSTIRYASAINCATGQTNPITFGATGTSMTNPFIIGTLALEPVNTQTGVGFAGPGIAGSWIQGQFASVIAPTGGGALIFRLAIIKP